MISLSQQPWEDTWKTKTSSIEYNRINGNMNKCDGSFIGIQLIWNKRKLIALSHLSLVFPNKVILVVGLNTHIDT